MFFHVEVPQWVWVSGGFITPAQPMTGFLNYGPCPVYYSGRSRRYVGNDVVDELISSKTNEPLGLWCVLRI